MIKVQLLSPALFKKEWETLKIQGFLFFFVYFSAIWGTGFYKTMSRSLKEEFPSVSGFSVTNLKYIKRFFEFYKSDRYF